MDTSFSYQLRVAACDRCGGPCEVNVAGGSFACRFCNAHNQLALRDETLLAPPAYAPVSEQERLTRLRMQDGKPLEPPSSIQHLFEGGRLPEWKMNEAVAIWNSTRQELRQARGNFDAAERLVFMTMMLSQSLPSGEKLRERSLLEGCLDAVSLPRHRQIMRGFLARAAVRAGDVQAAEAWLAPCDARADDLQMDSAYRFSRAFIDTARGDFPRVLEVLGPGQNDVPIDDAADDVCTVLRANAWEKLGRVDQAVSLLRERMVSGGGSGRELIGRVVEAYAGWQLAALSYPQASAGHAQVAGRAAAKRASGGIHRVFIPLGALCIVGGLVAFVVMTLGIEDVVDMGTGYDRTSALQGFGILGGTLAFLGVIFLGIGLVMRKSAQRAAWLRVHGLAATAEIQGTAPTGLTINGVPQMEITLLVRLPGRAPYQAYAKALMSGAMPSGGTVSLRVHPNDPNEVLIETD
jgi:hypothetical protein